LDESDNWGQGDGGGVKGIRKYCFGDYLTNGIRMRRGGGLDKVLIMGILL
jgi:hypothetical protein